MPGKVGFERGLLALPKGQSIQLSHSSRHPTLAIQVCPAGFRRGLAALQRGLDVIGAGALELAVQNLETVLCDIEVGASANERPGCRAHKEDRRAEYHLATEYLASLACQSGLPVCRCLASSGLSSFLASFRRQHVNISEAMRLHQLARLAQSGCRLMFVGRPGQRHALTYFFQDGFLIHTAPPTPPQYPPGAAVVPAARRGRRCAGVRRWCAGYPAPRRGRNRRG